MTVNEAIEVAGRGYRIEGLTDGCRVVGFRVLTADSYEVAVFKDADGGRAPAQPLLSSMDTSSR